MDANWETMQASAHGPSACGRDHLDVRVVADSVLVLAVADGSGGTDARRGHLGARWAVEELMRCAVPFARVVAETEDDVDLWPTLANRAERLGGQIRRSWRERARMHEANGSSIVPRRVAAPVPASALVPYSSSLLGAVLSPRLLFCWQFGSGDIALVGDRGVRPLFDDRPRNDASMRFHWQPAAAIGGRRLVLLNTDGLSRAFAERTAYQGFVENVYARSVRRGGQAVRDRLGGWLEQAAERSADDATLVAAYVDDGSPRPVSAPPRRPGRTSASIRFRTSIGE